LPNRILLVRLRQIGDVVLTTPAVRAIRERFPDAHISYVVEPAAAAVVEHNPHLNEVLIAPRDGGVARDLSLCRQLRAHRFDLAIDFHGGPRASLITWLSRAPMRIGYDVIGRSWMYTHRVARPRALRPRHSVENQWDLLAPLGIGPPDRTAFPVEMAVDASAARAVQTRLASAGVSDRAQLIVVHVSARSPFRRWPADSFVSAVASLAAERDDRCVIVTSGPSEARAADDVIERARTRLGPARAHRVLQCGEFSIAELRALVERAVLYIGGDSGPMHVAATAPTAIVALYGPTLPARSAPWRPATRPGISLEPPPLPCRPCDQRVCAPGDFRCQTMIAPEQVVAAAERLLTAVR
jgi:ADP-heptose:LPS heptosyltransferase